MTIVASGSFDRLRTSYLQWQQFSADLRLLSQFRSSPHHFRWRAIPALLTGVLKPPLPAAQRFSFARWLRPRGRVRTDWPALERHGPLAHIVEWQLADHPNPSARESPPL